MGKFEGFILGWRGAALAALIAVLAAIPGLTTLPATDRNESLFVQATVQMLESGDYTSIRYQDRWRGGAAPAGHWLQAATVALVSSPEAREVWAYRLISLLGGALAAAAAVWGGSGLFGKGPAFVAGVGLASSFVLSTAAGVATADALFAGAMVLAFAAFARLYLAGREGRDPRRRDRVFLWAGLIGGVLLKGPLALGLMAATALVLVCVDRRADWQRRIGWGWGLIALFAFAGPWVVAVTIATDGAYWTPLPPGPQTGAPLAWQTLVLPMFIFPATALIPLAAVFAWRERASSDVRLALAWLIPNWLVFEILPNKQVFATLPLYVAVLWLGAAALFSPAIGRLTRLVGAGASVACGVGMGALFIWTSGRFGSASDLALGIVAAALFAGAGIAAAAAVRAPTVRSLLVAGVFGLVAPAFLTAALLPNLERLWPTRQALAALKASGLDPHQGLAVGPVATAGYAEPSLVFALSARTQTGDSAAAAQAIADGRPAIVEQAFEPGFQSALKRLRVRAEPVRTFDAFDYAEGRDITLTLYRRGK